MSDDATETRPYGGNTRAAWLATATGIPIYVVMWAIVWGPGVQLFGALADLEPRPTVENSTLAAIAAVNILVVLVGIALVAHTAGRLLFVRTAHMAIGQSAVAFAAMSAILSVVLVVFIGIAQDDAWPAVAAAIVIVMVPCVVSSAATRALLPLVDRYAALRGTVTVLLVLAVIAVVAFTFYAYAGAGQ